MEVISNQMGVPKQDMDKLKTLLEKKERQIIDMQKEITQKEQQVQQAFSECTESKKTLQES